MKRRMAEVLTALTLSIFAIYLMYESAKLPIGWLNSGPGGGMFPFWMSFLVLVGSVITLLKSLWHWKDPDGMHPTPELDEAGEHGVHPGGMGRFIAPEAANLLLAVVILLIGSVGVTQFLGMYVGVPLMIFIYLFFIGKHSWWVTGIFTLLTPVVMFFFFEISLRIILPKGATEKLFQHIYALIG